MMPNVTILFLGDFKSVLAVITVVVTFSFLSVLGFMTIPVFTNCCFGCD